MTIEDILNPDVREKSEEFEGYLYIVSQGLNFNSGADLLKTVNLSIIIFPNYILSFHNDPIKSSVYVLDRIRREGLGKLPSKD